MRARSTWLAAALFASLAVAATGVVQGSGRQIVDTARYAGYAESIEAGLMPYRDFDVEYPPGALALFLAPALVGASGDAYFWAFASLMAAAGAGGVLLTAACLDRLGRSPRIRRRALVALAVSPVLFAGVLLTRFDLAVAAVVAGATLALLTDRPRLAAVLVGVGAAIKLYPLLLLPLLLVWTWRRQGRRRAFVPAVLAVGVVVLAYLPFAVLAPASVAESVWRQLSRPLQIESVGAGILVLLGRLAGLDIEVETSYGSQNLVGPLPAAVAVVLAVVGTAALLGAWTLFARCEADAEDLVRFAAAVLVAFVAFGKVASPQFLVWLLFPLALVAGRRGVVARACFGVAAVATAIWFPWRYFDLARELDPLVAALVVLRGVALAVAFGVLLLPGFLGVRAVRTEGARARARSPG